MGQRTDKVSTNVLFGLKSINVHKNTFVFMKVIVYVCLHTFKVTSCIENASANAFH